MNGILYEKCIFSGGIVVESSGASTTVRLHIKYETKQLPWSCPGRRPRRHAQSAQTGVVRKSRRPPPGGSVPAPCFVPESRSSDRHVGRSARGRLRALHAITYTSKTVRNRTRCRHRVWLVAAASKPASPPPAVVGRRGTRTGILQADELMFGNSATQTNGPPLVPLREATAGFLHDIMLDRTGARKYGKYDGNAGVHFAFLTDVFPSRNGPGEMVFYRFTVFNFISECRVCGPTLISERYYHFSIRVGHYHRWGLLRFCTMLFQRFILLFTKARVVGRLHARTMFRKNSG